MIVSITLYTMVAACADVSMCHTRAEPRCRVMSVRFSAKELEGVETSPCREMLGIFDVPTLDQRLFLMSLYCISRTSSYSCTIPSDILARNSIGYSSDCVHIQAVLSCPVGLCVFPRSATLRGTATLKHAKPQASCDRGSSRVQARIVQ